MISDKLLLTLNDVSYHYKIRKGIFTTSVYTALQDISFSIRKGETIGIIGDNGAGKSTLLKVIANILGPSTGSITRHEESLSISLLSLQLGFSAELTGMDNLILGAMFLGHTKKQALEKADDIIKFAELENWIHEPFKSYSSGMRARLGFAVANELSPDILLVDEALGVGDRSFQMKSAETIKRKMSSGQTVVFVSHNVSVIREICTRCIWLEKGKVVLKSDTEEVLTEYLKTR